MIQMKYVDFDDLLKCAEGYARYVKDDNHDFMTSIKLLANAAAKCRRVINSNKVCDYCKHRHCMGCMELSNFEGLEVMRLNKEELDD